MKTNRPLKITAGIFDIINALLIIAPWAILMIRMLSDKDFYTALQIMLIIFPAFIIFAMFMLIPLAFGTANIVVGVKTFLDTKKEKTSNGLFIYALISETLCSLICFPIAVSAAIELFAYGKGSSILEFVFPLAITLISTPGVILNTLCLETKKQK